MTVGLSLALEFTVTVPVAAPGAPGSKFSDNVQTPPAAIVPAQESDSEKIEDGDARMEDIVTGVELMLRTVTVAGPVDAGADADRLAPEVDGSGGGPRKRRSGGPGDLRQECVTGIGVGDGYREIGRAAKVAHYRHIPGAIHGDSGCYAIRDATVKAVPNITGKAAQVA